MGLCGSIRCGCGVTSSPAVSGAVDGYLPSIEVSGSGEAGDPYDLSLNDAWAAVVAGALTRTGMMASRTTNQSIPVATLTVITFPTEVSDTDGFFTPGGSTITIPTGKGGLYAISVVAVCTTGVGGGYVRLTPSGVPNESWNSAMSGGAGTCSITVPLVPGDTISAGLYNPADAGSFIARSQIHVNRIGL